MPRPEQLLGCLSYYPNTFQINEKLSELYLHSDDVHWIVCGGPLGSVNGLTLQRELLQSLTKVSFNVDGDFDGEITQAGDDVYIVCCKPFLTD